MLWFLRKKFHFTCISKSNKSYKKNVITLLIDIPNLQWYCDDCIPFTINGTYSGILKNINTCVNALSNTVGGHQPDNGSISTISQPIQNQIHTPIQIDNTTDNQSNSSESVANTSIISIDMTPDEISNANFFTVNAKRKLSPPLEKAKRRKSNIHSPSQSSHLGDFVAVKKTQINTTDNDENYRCIYVTPFKPTTDTSEIISHLKSFGSIREFVDRIKCVKLISEKVNQNKLSFVSFKILVPGEYFNLVAEQSVWPEGISVKEFETHLKIKEKPQPNIQKSIKRNYNSNIQKSTHQKNTQLSKSNFRPRQKITNQALTQIRPHLNQSAYSMMNYPMIQPMINPQMLWNMPGLQNQMQNQFQSHRKGRF